MTKSARLRVGVLFGGRSGEHEVSLMSARTVTAALDEAGYETIPIGITPSGRWLVTGDPMGRLSSKQEDALDAPSVQHEQNRSFTNSNASLPAVLLQSEERLPSVDLVFPVLHGPYGEDGTVQGLLEMANLPYVGCGVLSSATGMDKAISKQLFAAAGLPQTAYRVLMRHRWQTEPTSVHGELERDLTYPMFVKPANLGSSVGISKAKTADQLRAAIDLACTYDRKVIVEEGVTNARELEVSVLGNIRPRASVPGEVVPGNEFYDYEAKYYDDNSQLLIPAPLSDEQVDRLQRLAVQAFQTLDCSGLARVDFLMDEDQTIYLNEVNTMPGFTHASMYPRLWEASGLPLQKLVQQLVELALERHQDRQQNRTVVGNA